MKIKPINPFPEIKPWRGTEKHELLANPRRAEFWRRDENSQDVKCNLCYRLCSIPRGEAGWCKHRVNEQGRMAIPHYGELGRCLRLRLGTGGGGMYSYHTSALAVVVGGIHCTSSCTFCTSANIVWNPDKLPWLPRAELGGKSPEKGRWAGNDQGWFYARGMMHVDSVMWMAEFVRATHIVFGDNEPTLSWEHTFDVARVAKRAGMNVVLFTNGFTEAPAIRKLAPYIDAVDLGVKGSLSDAFYARWMRSPGAPAAVWRSMLEWHNAGVHLVVSNLLATPTMQSDDEFIEASKRLHGYVLEHVGEHALIMQGSMHYPTGHRLRRKYFVPEGPTHQEHLDNYEARAKVARTMARQAGLIYEYAPDPTFHCHNCGHWILRYAFAGCQNDPCTQFTHYCLCWSHEQHTSDDGRHCGKCGAAVPIKMLPYDKMRQAYKDAGELAARGDAQFGDPYAMIAPDASL